MKHAVFSILVIAALFMMQSPSGIADIPHLINYQGRLTDSLGIPVPDSTYQITFSIYNAESDGDQLWSSGQQEVQVIDGLFTYQLGQAVPLPNDLFATDTIRYLGITVGGEPELIPRSRLISAAYAYQALRADSAAYALSIADNTIDSNAIQPSSISFSDVAQNGASVNQIMKWNGSAWVPADDAGAGGGGGWVDSGHYVYLSDFRDSVGIGTETPTARLHVNGPINVGLDSVGDAYDVNFFSGFLTGRLLWDASERALRVGRDTDGTHWMSDSIGQYSVAMGYNTKAIASGSFATGSGTTARGDNSTALGDETHATGQSSIAMGWSTTANGSASFASGHSTTASGNYSTALGNGADAVGIGSFAAGKDCTSGGEYSAAIGFSASSAGNHSISIGHYPETDGNYSVAIGYGAVANGDSAFSFGAHTTSSGNKSLALGSSTTANGLASTAMGNGTAAIGDYSTAMGCIAIANGAYSFAQGYNAEANGSYSYALGRWVKTGNYSNAFVIGSGQGSAPSQLLTNNKSQSLIIGFNSPDPTLYVDGSRVGIGTTDPKTKLDVSDIIRVQGNTWPGSGSGLEFAFNPDQLKGYIQVVDRDSTPDKWGQLYLGNGTVGIGTTDPGVKLQVVGGTDIDDGLENSGYFIIGSSTGTHLGFDNNEIMAKASGTTTTTLYFQHDGGDASFGGEVGIRTSTPLEALHVNGRVYIDTMFATASGSPVRWASGRLYYQSSSARYKDDIQPLDYDAYKILMADPKSFIDKASGQREVGYIAEEFEALGLNELVRYRDGLPDGVKYDVVPIYMLEIVKDLVAENRELKQKTQEIDILRTQIAELQSQMKTLLDQSGQSK